MKKRYLFIMFFFLAASVFLLAERTQALPEYAAQTGEPCASCHISPSGGGARTPRGQAWVGSGRQAAVPGLFEALEQLGVHWTVDESVFKKDSGAVSPAQPLPLQSGLPGELHDWINTYGGN